MSPSSGVAFLFSAVGLPPSLNKDYDLLQVAIGVSVARKGGEGHRGTCCGENFERNAQMIDSDARMTFTTDLALVRGRI